MNHLRRFGTCLLALLLCWALSPRAHGQSFLLAAEATPNPVVVSNPITYSISVTSFVSTTSYFLTNRLSGSFRVLGQSNNVNALVTTNSSGVVFQYNSQVAQFQLVVAPDAGGPFTNAVSVHIPNATNTISTNLVTTVQFPDGDLAVGLTNASTAVLTNDPTVIGLFVTNLGSAAVSGVVVSNVFPTNLIIVSVAPTNATTSTSGSNFVWTVGSLTNGQNSQLLVTVRPTAPGQHPLQASVTGNLTDTNQANNVATNLLEAGGYLDADLSPSVLSQVLNPQTGLLEMSVEVVNEGTNSVPAVRLEVSGLPATVYLYNAQGTNGINPYVQYNSPVPAGSNVVFLLEFYTLTRTLLATNEYQLNAYALSPGSTGTTATNGVQFTGIELSAGSVLLQFSATIGKTYTIIYADNMSFSNAYEAQPSIVAGATEVQWIDNGPPKTISPPGTGSRLYRVRQDD